MKRYRPLLLTMLLGLLVLPAAFYLLLGSPVRLYYNHQLKQALREPPPAAETVTLNTLIPFAWDTVYTFGPYTSRAEMEAAIGIRDPHLPESIDESQRPLVVVENGRVRACVCGYPSAMGFSVQFQTDTVARTDCTVFRVQRTPEHIKYTQILP